MREGYYADADGIHPWHESLVAGGLDRFQGKPTLRSVKARHAPETVTMEVAPLIKRTPQERLAEVTQRIYDEAMKSYAALGRVAFPPSILADIQQQFWQAGEPITLEQIERLAHDEIRPLCERYAAASLNTHTNRHGYLKPEIKGA